MKFFSQIERPQRRKRDAGIKTLIMASRAQIVHREQQKKGAVIRQFRFVKVNHFLKGAWNVYVCKEKPRVIYDPLMR